MPFIPAMASFPRTQNLARLCEEKDIAYVGPSSAVIQRMGDKTEARTAHDGGWCAGDPRFRG